jgi:hypothetical protein
LCYFFVGCLIPSEDASSDSAHYVSKNDSLSLTNFAIMDGDESPDGGSEKSDDDIGVHSVFSMYWFWQIFKRERLNF